MFWLPKVIHGTPFTHLCSPRYGHLDKVWHLLKQLLPEFKLPDLEEQAKTTDVDDGGGGVKKDSKSDETASTKESRKEDKPGKEGKEGKSKLIDQSDLFCG